MSSCDKYVSASLFNVLESIGLASNGNDIPVFSMYLDYMFTSLHRERSSLAKNQKILILVFLVLFVATNESLNFLALSFLRYKI